MKILFVTSRVPWPLDKGDKLRAFHQLRSLSLKAEVYLFCINDLPLNEIAIEELKKYCKEIKVVNISKIGVGFNMLSAFFSGLPLQVGYFYNSKIQNEFNKFANRIKADKIYCQLIRTAKLIEGRQEKRVIDYMDVFSKGIDRRIDKVSFFLRGIYKMERRRLLRYEEKVFMWFDERVIISEQDRNLIPHIENKKIHIISNGVDLDYFYPLSEPKEFDILFNGNMHYPPNIEAVEFLCYAILPIVIQKYPKIKVLISGTQPTPRVLALQSQHVLVTGRVEDVRASFAKCRMLVAPMQSSIGLQNKLLEAMAMGIPCVTSYLANNALKAKNGEQILVASSPQEYANQIFSLLENNSLYSTLVENARLFIKNNYSWSELNEKLFNILELE